MGICSTNFKPGSPHLLLSHDYSPLLTVIQSYVLLQLDLHLLHLPLLFHDAVVALLQMILELDNLSVPGGDFLRKLANFYLPVSQLVLDLVIFLEIEIFASSSNL